MIRFTAQRRGARLKTGSPGPNVSDCLDRMAGVALLALSLCPLAAAAPETIPAGSFSLETNTAQHVTVLANDAPLQDVLSELAGQLDIELKGQVPDGSRITADVRDQPLPEALKRISENYMLVTDESDGHVVKIILLPKGDGSRYVAPVQAARPAPEAYIEEADPSGFDPDVAAAESPPAESALGFDADAVQSDPDPTTDFEAQMNEDLKDE